MNSISISTPHNNDRILPSFGSNMRILSILLCCASLVTNTSTAKPTTTTTNISHRKEERDQVIPSLSLTPSLSSLITTKTEVRKKNEKLKLLRRVHHQDKKDNITRTQKNSSSYDKSNNNYIEDNCVDQNDAAYEEENEKDKRALGKISLGSLNNNDEANIWEQEFLLSGDEFDQNEIILSFSYEYIEYTHTHLHKHRRPRPRQRRKREKKKKSRKKRKEKKKKKKSRKKRKKKKKDKKKDKKKGKSGKKTYYKHIHPHTHTHKQIDYNLILKEGNTGTKSNKKMKKKEIKLSPDRIKLSEMYNT